MTKPNSCFLETGLSMSLRTCSDTDPSRRQGSSTATNRLPGSIGRRRLEKTLCAWHAAGGRKAVSSAPLPQQMATKDDLGKLFPAAEKQFLGCWLWSVAVSIWKSPGNSDLGKHVRLGIWSKARWLQRKDSCCVWIKATCTDYLRYGAMHFDIQTINISSSSKHRTSLPHSKKGTIYIHKVILLKDHHLMYTHTHTHI